ncbi:YIP1 family protein [Weeksellaceae bacterium TAE3-ERU29]|nr:YIP1 family protein [Weeksellaceae bacterium TAE3-ERU29]
MKWKTFFNPFTQFSDQKLTQLSIISLMLIYGVCSLFLVKLDGIFHITNADSIREVWIFNSFIIVLAIIILGLLGKLFKSKSRWIDIFHSVCISLFPMSLIVILSNIPIIKNSIEAVQKIQANPSEVATFNSELIILSIFGLISLPLIIYSVILMFNGFKTATNSKKWQSFALFFVVLFLMNMLTQIFEY